MVPYYGQTWILCKAGQGLKLKEIGSIEKTIFILDYVLNKSLRRRVQRGINKGETMNVLEAFV